MLDRIVREATRYEVCLQGDVFGIVDRYTRQVIVASLTDADKPEQLAFAMNRQAVRNTLWLPSMAMLEAGGTGSADLWTLMIAAVR